MNRLADARSLYLRQHADNPVDWYPWGAEALDAARETGKPILLSIGYSACHWCHVMAHESFEDPATAALMNEKFVNIKVDREERPDLDRIHQLAHQALTRRAGGWPLTVFLDPESRIPFFAGTYFPPRSRHGMLAFRDVLLRIETFFREHPDQLAEQNAAMRTFFDDVSAAAPGALPGLGVMDTAIERLGGDFDRQQGGFGGAPKFPNPATLELLALADDEASQSMLALTLENMGRGGLLDQLGGGFFRYCVDARWTIPHFEKMLYDNAQLLPLYARRAALAGDSVALRAVRRTVGWLEREMRSPEGLFHASLDADSEGGEGSFYVWSADQFEEALRIDHLPCARRVFGLDEPPNFEGKAWHLLRRRPLAGVAEDLGLTPEEVMVQLAAAEERLREHRAQRPRPGRDDKILSAWNALLVRGLARAGRWLDEPGWVDLAQTAMDGLTDAADGDGRLPAVIGSELPGFLDDHAFALIAGLELLQSRWSDRTLDFLVCLADLLLTRFEDPEHGGFFFTADDHEELVQRPRSFMDDSLPSGNGMAVIGLCGLGHLVGETRYLEAAERALRAGASDLERAPHACATLLIGLAAFQDPPRQILLRGKLDRPLRDERVFSIPDDSRLAEQYARTGRFTAYVCEGTRCGEPIVDPAALSRALSGD